MRLPKPPAAIPFGRPESNRRNAQLSTGPRTTEGKRRSSQNAFRHGLYSKQLVTPDECAAELDELRATLRREHAPASTIEEILVDDLAQHFWRLRRFREMEARVWQPDSNLFTPATLALLARHLASAERSFFRTLAALTKLQQARGFVPQKQPAAAAATATTSWISPPKTTSTPRLSSASTSLPLASFPHFTGKQLHQPPVRKPKRHPKAAEPHHEEAGPNLAPGHACV